METPRIDQTKDSLVEYYQLPGVKLKCSIDLSKLFPFSEDRERFKERLKNLKGYTLDADKLIYDSEQLIPTKTDSRPPLLFVLGNPATHSVERGMFFSSEGKKRGEHRFWKKILPDAGIKDLCFKDLPENERNDKRRNKLLELDYQSQCRMGLCVFISFPSNASRDPKNKLEDYSGIQGVKRLFGTKAFNELVKYERKRVFALIKEFVTRDGAVFTFQSDAWNELRSNEDRVYSISAAKAGKLEGTVAETPEIRLFGLPPTRLSGPAGRVLKKFFDKIGL
jgi:hypothetical protein